MLLRLSASAALPSPAFVSRETPRRRDDSVSRLTTATICLPCRRRPNPRGNDLVLGPPHRREVLGAARPASATGMATNGGKPGRPRSPRRQRAEQTGRYWLRSRQGLCANARGQTLRTSRMRSTRRNSRPTECRSVLHDVSYEGCHGHRQRRVDVACALQRRALDIIPTCRCMTGRSSLDTRSCAY